MDEQLFFLINSHHTPFFDTMMFCISQKTVWVPLYISLLYVVWKNYSWKGALAVLLMVGIAMFFTDFVNDSVIRQLIGRLRPSAPQNPIAPMVHTVFGQHGSGYGMPSAHSANMWMLTGIMIYWIRDRWMAWTMSLLTLLVCYSRVYLGFHYPGDILGGFVLSLTVVSTLCHFHNKKCHFMRVTHPAHSWVPTIIAALTIISFCISAAML